MATINNIFIVVLYVKGSTNSHFLPKHSLCRRKVQVENQQDNNKKTSPQVKKSFTVLQKVSLQREINFAKQKTQCNR